MGRKANPAVDVKQKADAFPAKRIKERMDAKSISSPSLAKLLGVSPQAVNQYRQGIATPSCRSLLEIAHILDTTTDWLLGDAEGHSADNQKIYERLGLSDYAIRFLESEKAAEYKSAIGRGFAGVINELIESEDGQDVLRTLSVYFFEEFTEGYSTKNSVLDGDSVAQALLLHVPAGLKLVRDEIISMRKAALSNSVEKEAHNVQESEQ